MAKKRIIVEVSGGLLVAVHTNIADEISVDIMDWDNARVNLKDKRECKKLESAARGMKRIFP